MKNRVSLMLVFAVISALIFCVSQAPRAIADDCNNGCNTSQDACNGGCKKAGDCEGTGCKNLASEGNDVYCGCSR
jgi:hypothetical protein